jgi:hypothetical protein
MNPGLYFYNFYGWAAGAPEGGPGGFCSSGNQQVVVLPGDSIRVSIDPRYSTGVIDDIERPLVVYGVADPALRLRLLGFSGSPRCGTRVSNMLSMAINMERDSVGYWSVDAVVADSAVKPVFALGVRQGSQTWYLRFVSNEMAIFYNGLPESTRFDLTPRRLRTALASPPDTLLCL